MNACDFGLHLRNGLGPEACEDLSNAFMEAQNEMLMTSADRFDGRLIGFGAELRADLARTQSELRGDLTRTHSDFRAELTRTQSEFRAELACTKSELRQEMTQMDAGLRVAFMEGFSKLRADLADVRVEAIRWSFLFWVGQLAAMAALLAYMLRSR